MKAELPNAEACKEAIKTRSHRDAANHLGVSLGYLQRRIYGYSSRRSAPIKGASRIPSSVIDELVERLRDARLQLEYLHEDLPRGSTAGILARIRATLAKVEA